MKMVHRSLLGLAALLAASSLSGVASAGSLDDVKHVVVFMQENRAFDHYYGTLSGVRGFNDRTTVPLRNGFDAFHQPLDLSDLSSYMLPFRAEANRTNAMCFEAPEMYYPTDINILNGGRMDAWNTARDGGYGMSFFTRDDLPFYYQLYDNFAVGDQYFQSTFTCTCPNRLHLFSGSNGLSVGEFATLENNEPVPGWNWTTMGEILEDAGVSWQVYQEQDNFDDNGFAWHATFQSAKAGEPLYDKGMFRFTSAIDAFKEAVMDDTLPQVSWIIAPQIKSEHATAHPCEGEDWTAQVLAALQGNPEVYKKTVFILNYDEGGQFYDHAFTPTPPMPAGGVIHGKSTVTTDGEINRDVLTDRPAPIGLGFRVPLLIVSPWTRGNIVVSEVFDHTSVIKFLEKKFNVKNPNLSPWRRAMVGDLLSAFDFVNPPDFSWPDLPDTSNYVSQGNIQCETLPDVVIPSTQTMPKQESGTRRSKALPYTFLVSDAGVQGGSSSFSFTISNTGLAGAPFVLFDLLNLDTATPRNYAVEGGKSLTDSVPVVSQGGLYAFVLMGPNGFVREFSGTVEKCSDSYVMLNYEPATEEVVVVIDATAETEDASFGVLDNAYDKVGEPVVIDVKAGTVVAWKIAVASVGNWYDLTVGLLPEDAKSAEDVSRFLAKAPEDYGPAAGSVAPLGGLSNNASSSTGSSSCHVRRFLGRMETGVDTISDPAMAEGVQGLWGKGVDHPQLPEGKRVMKRGDGKSKGKRERKNKDAIVYDAGHVFQSEL